MLINWLAMLNSLPHEFNKDLYNVIPGSKYLSIYSIEWRVYCNLSCFRRNEILNIEATEPFADMTSPFKMSVSTALTVHLTHLPFIKPTPFISTNVKKTIPNGHAASTKRRDISYWKLWRVISWRCPADFPAEGKVAKLCGQPWFCDVTTLCQTV